MGILKLKPKINEMKVSSMHFPFMVPLEEWPIKNIYLFYEIYFAPYILHV